MEASIFKLIGGWPNWFIIGGISWPCDRHLAEFGAMPQGGTGCSKTDSVSKMN
jgi:hypothetical protein